MEMVNNEYVSQLRAVTENMLSFDVSSLVATDDATRPSRDYSCVSGLSNSFIK